MTGSLALALPPGWILMLGALAVPLLRGRLLGAWLLLLPIAGFAQLLSLPYGDHWEVPVFRYTLELMRVDRLSLVFGYIFHIAAFLAVVYAVHVRMRLQHVATLIYAGSAIGAVFAGDLITLFIYSEIAAVASVFLIWARRTERAYRAGMRYLIIQVGAGVMLLAGIVWHATATGSIAFGKLGLVSPATTLIFIAFGVKCAFPLLHNWLTDAYPEATVTGAVVLSAFTTKFAVYTLARGFPGTEMLIWIGAAMTAFPVFYALIENDLRRVLAYSLINQLGFMVVGIGIGTELALNGTAAHAFAHILYKALLFMALGAVLLRTGTARASELGGLYAAMPFTAIACLVGAASISAVPLFSGFITKALILDATAGGGHAIVWLVMVFAAAAEVVACGIKVPYRAFFQPAAGRRRLQPLPRNMPVAMGLTAALCVAIGVYPDPLYALLPFAVDYRPYTATHVVGQLQLLLFAALAFVLLLRAGVCPPEVKGSNLDSDWFYRRLAPEAIRTLGTPLLKLGRALRTALLQDMPAALARSLARGVPGGLLARSWSVATAVIGVMVLLLGYLIVDLFG